MDWHHLIYRMGFDRGDVGAKAFGLCTGKRNEKPCERVREKRKQ